MRDVMSGRFRVAFAATFLLSFAVLTVWVGWRRPESSTAPDALEPVRSPMAIEGPNAAAHDLEASLGAVSSLRLPRPAEVESVSLPEDHPALDLAAEAPLADQLDVLSERASRGHPVAACRLARASMYCASRAHSEQFAGMLEDALAGQDKILVGGPLLDALVAFEGGRELGSRYCEGVDASRLPDPGETLRPALSHLNVRQKVVLAMLRPDGSVRRLNEFWAPTSGRIAGAPPDYLYPQFLSDHVLDYFDAGIAAADPLALEGAILFHTPIVLPREWMELRPLLPDARRFLAFSMLYERLFGAHTILAVHRERMAQATAALTQDDLTLVARFVDAEERRWRELARRRHKVLATPAAFASPLEGCDG